MVIEVLGRDGQTVCVTKTCALCDKAKPLSALTLWRGPGQKLVLCELCFEVLDAAVEQRTEAA